LHEILPKNIAKPKSSTSLQYTKTDH